MVDFLQGKELFLNEKLKIIINRNDFDELGSILEIQLHPENIKLKNIMILLSFYDKNQKQIAQDKLLLLNIVDHTFFENILSVNISENLISNNFENKSLVTLKFLNSEIFYVKIYTHIISSNIQNTSNSNKKLPSFNSSNSLSQSTIKSSNIIDVYNLDFYDINLNNSNFNQTFSNMNNLISSSSIEKNDQINLILQELNSVNLSLISEKETIEKNKQSLKLKEENINSSITTFKKDVMIYCDKFYTEAYSIFNNKLNEVQKKLNHTENNVLNKIKLIKEKNNVSFTNKSKGNTCKDRDNPESGTIFKEKIANLEIKLKFLEDSANNLKSKLNEKEVQIKFLLESEEKLNKNLRKLKEENINLNSKLKNFEDKDASQPTQSSQIQNSNINKKNSNLEKELKNNPKSCTPMKKLMKKKYEFSKHLVNQYTDSFVLDLLLSSNSFQYNNELFSKSLNDNEISLCVNILINIALNPISLFQKFPFSFIFAIRKILNFTLNNHFKFYTLDNNNISFGTLNSTNNMKLCLNEVINTYSELKKNLNDSNYIIKSKEIFWLLDLSISIEQGENQSQSQSQLNLNNMLVHKLNLFANFMNKNEKKYLEKNNYANYKLISLSILIYKLILTGDLSELTAIVKYILNEIIYTRDFFSINYLIFSLNYFTILITIMSNLYNLSISQNTERTNDKNEELNSIFQNIFFLFLDTFLFLYSLDSRFNIFEDNRKLSDILKDNKFIFDILIREITNSNMKIIIFAGIISNYTNLNIKIDVKTINIIENSKSQIKEIMSNNLNRIFI